MDAAQMLYEACQTTFDLIRHAVSQNRMITVAELNECFQKCGQAVRAFEREQATAPSTADLFAGFLECDAGSLTDGQRYERAIVMGEVGE